MAGKARAWPSALDSPSIEARLLAGEGRNLLDESDDSGFMDLNSKDFDRMNLVDTPPVQRTASKHKTHLSSPGKSGAARRPSWGPRSSPSKGKMRLLEGVEAPVEGKRRERTLGGLGQDKTGGTLKPRQSIFAKPAFLQSRAPERRESLGQNEREDEGEDSFYKDPALSSSTGSVKGRVAAIESSRLQEAAGSTSGGGETKEQVDNQLAELKKMNSVFEAYERMLSGSADQIETFAQRISETNSLLDVYIDLMRQADQTQQLLLDGDWKGATEDESAHALALELAERERQRRQREADEAARLVALRKHEAEQARRQAELAEKAKAAAPLARGAKGGMPPGRGAAPSTRGTTASRTSSTTRGRTASATSSTRGGAPSASRTASSASGLNNRYASVRSSGYGPPK